MNKTEPIAENYLDLIRKISSELTPVKPIQILPLLFKWSLLSIGTCLINIIYHARPDLPEQLNTPLFYLPISLLGVGLALGMYGVLLSGFPGRVPKSRHYILLSGIGTGLWILWYLLPIGIDLLHHHALSLDNGEACSKQVLLMAFIPLLSGLFFLRKLAPTQRRPTSLLLFAMATLIGTLSISFICPSASSVHILGWHFLPIIMMGTLGAGLGLRLFNW
jgi:hypothetical protein